MIEEFKGKKKESVIIPHNEKESNVTTFRPERIVDFVGQERMLKQLRIYIESSKKQNKQLDHVLLYGPAGLGKTTLASIIANEMGSQIKVAAAPVFEKNGDIAALLSSINPGDFIFIDEIHRLKVSLEEILFPAMEDHKLDIIIGKGGASQSVRLNLPPFTLVGATTKAGNISKPLRTRFGIVQKLDFYTHKSLKEIIVRGAGKLNIPINDKAAEILAKRSRGTPRIALRLLRRVFDYAIYHDKKTIDQEITFLAMSELGIDEKGLDQMDRRMLSIMVEDYDGGPIGLQTLAIAVGEDVKTIEDYYEPYLIQNGLIKRTPKGRVITKKGESVI